MTGDERQIKEGWNNIRPDKFIQIIKQMEDIAEGKADILSLFMYLDREEMNQREKEREGGQFKLPKGGEGQFKLGGGGGKIPEGGFKLP